MMHQSYNDGLTQTYGGGNNQFSLSRLNKASRGDASSVRAVLPLPPEFVVSEAERLAAASFTMQQAVDGEEVRRKMGVTLDSGIKLPSILGSAGGGRPNTVFELKRSVMKEKRKGMKASSSAAALLDAGGISKAVLGIIVRPVTSQGLPFEKLGMPPVRNHQPKAVEHEHEHGATSEDEEFLRTKGFVDEDQIGQWGQESSEQGEIEDSDYVEHVPGYYERQRLRAIASLYQTEDQRSFNLTKRIFGAPYREGGKLTTSLRDYDMPIEGVGRGGEGGIQEEGGSVSEDEEMGFDPTDEL